MFSWQVYIQKTRSDSLRMILQPVVQNKVSKYRCHSVIKSEGSSAPHSLTIWECPLKGLYYMCNTLVRWLVHDHDLSTTYKAKPTDNFYGNI